jgi:hypothetical protein
MNIAQTSLWAHDTVTEVQRRRDYQKILATLSDGLPRTREMIEEETHRSGNTIRPRCKELLDKHILIKAGLGTTRSGYRAELLTLNIVRDYELDLGPRDVSNAF